MRSQHNINLYVLVGEKGHMCNSFYFLVESTDQISNCVYRTDSEIFEDSVELQQFFVKIRDELCKNGEILLSPALSYTFRHLHADVEQEKREKLPQEMEEDRLKAAEDKKGILYVLCVTICRR